MVAIGVAIGIAIEKPATPYPSIAIAIPIAIAIAISKPMKPIGDDAHKRV